MTSAKRAPSRNGLGTVGCRFWRWAGVCFMGLSASGGLLACQNAGSRDAQTGASLPPSLEAPSAVSATENEPTSEGGVAQSRDKAEFDVAGAHVTVTLADTLAIEAALIARLQQSKLEDRDELIQGARDNRPSIEAGAVRDPRRPRLRERRIGRSGRNRLPPAGLLVQQVAPDGNAAKARIRGGDVLLKYGEVELTSVEKLTRAINENTKSITVSVWREGEEKPIVREVLPGHSA